MMPPLDAPIAVGARLIGPGLDMTVHGIALGSLCTVVWGPNACRGGKITAAKLVHQGLDVPLVRTAFEHETLAWCHLWPSHNLVSGLNVMRIPALSDTPALEMEYVPKGGLRSRLEALHRDSMTNAPVDSATAFDWLHQICSALDAIHAPDPVHDRPWSIVHGDLKPENILIASDGTARVSDPGMVRIWARLSTHPAFQSPEWEGNSELDRVKQCQAILPVSEDRSIGAIGPVAGTPPYMAPEQWMGIDALEPATDMYALGILIFELFSGVNGWPHIPNRRDTVGWHNAHLSGSFRKLVDFETAALNVGPLGHLSKPEFSQYARRALLALNDLMTRCISLKGETRPTAKEALALLSEAESMLGISIYDRGNVPETQYNVAQYWGGLGVSYCNVGQANLGIRLVRKSLDVDPNNLRHWVTLGKACLADGRAEEALRAFFSAEAYLSGHDAVRDADLISELLWSTGKVLLDLDQYPEAIMRFQASLVAAPNQGEVWAHMGLAYCLWATTASSDTEAYQHIAFAKLCCDKSLSIDSSSDLAHGIIAMIESGTTNEAQRFV